MKIATWNVNSVRTRLSHLLIWLKERAPDIVLLQELKAIDAQFPAEMIEDLGYNYAVAGQKSYNGVAILSKYPLEDIQSSLPGNSEDTQARYIEAVTGGVRVISVYVPNGQEVGSDKYAYKLAFLERLKRHFSALLKYEECLIAGGDYNIAPTSADVYNEKEFKDRILTSPAERAAFRQLCNLGLIDAVRALYPEENAENDKLFTWWDYRQGSWERNQGFRIDHLLLSPQAADCLLKAEVDTSMRGLPRPSDHAPLWCELKR
jgi:exodeoxyribonuclease-3